MVGLSPAKDYIDFIFTVLTAFGTSPVFFVVIRRRVFLRQMVKMTCPLTIHATRHEFCNVVPSFKDIVRLFRMFKFSTSFADLSTYETSRSSHAVLPATTTSSTL